MENKAGHNRLNIERIREMLREAETRGFTSLTKEEMRQKFKADLKRQTKAT